MLCNQCRIVCYCIPTCQRKHWTRHAPMSVHLLAQGPSERNSLECVTNSFICHLSSKQQIRLSSLVGKKAPHCTIIPLAQYGTNYVVLFASSCSNLPRHGGLWILGRYRGVAPAFSQAEITALNIRTFGRRGPSALVYKRFKALLHAAAFSQEDKTFAASLTSKLNGWHALMLELWWSMGQLCVGPDVSAQEYLFLS